MYTNHEAARADVDYAIDRALREVPGATKDDVPFWYVREIGRNSWRTRMKNSHIVRYYVAINDPVNPSNRPLMFKTKKDLDNKFDLSVLQDRIVEIIKSRLRLKQHQAKAHRTRKSNEDLIKRVANDAGVWDHNLDASSATGGGISIHRPKTVKVTVDNYDDVIAWIKHGVELGFFPGKNEE